MNELESWARVRTLVTNVIGFHALAEDEERPPSPLRRMEYEAQVYASGVALAQLLYEIMSADPPEEKR